MKLLDMTIVLDSPAELRRGRRTKRGVKERGRIRKKVEHRLGHAWVVGPRTMLSPGDSMLSVRSEPELVKLCDMTIFLDAPAELPREPSK